MSTVAPPSKPILYLIDGYALIYRAFFALLSRPLTTARGENTSAAWGIVNFLQRLKARYQPDYIGWVHDSGLSFRHEVLPEYKATREKLSEELQSDFDRGIARISELLDAYRIPILSVHGYEADDVIGTLCVQAKDAGVHVVIVSGDKDFYQLVQPGIWLLNPGRGGPAGVDEQLIGLENAAERLGVPPEHVTDYLALVGDTSDNVPGVPGIGDKTARELIASYGGLEDILRQATEVTKKRAREALLTHADAARLSKALVTIRTDVPVSLNLPALETKAADTSRLQQLFLELEFSTLLKELEKEAPRPQPATGAEYQTVDTLDALNALVERIRAVGHCTLDTETVIDPASPSKIDALRARLVGMSFAVAPGEAYYLPFTHRPYRPSQGDLLMVSEEVPVKEKAATKSTRSPTSIAARLLAEQRVEPQNLPPLESPPLASLRALLEDPGIRKTAQNAKYDILVLRRAGITLRGLEWDTMLASYVLDPGRRSHGLDLLALEFLNHRMTSYVDLCGKGRDQLPFDVVPVAAARDYSCEDVDITLRLRGVLEPQLRAHGLLPLFQEIEIPLVEVLADMEWVGIAIDTEWFRSLKERFRRERERVEEEIYEAAGERFNINSNQQLRVILFEKLGLRTRKRTATGPSTDASVLQELADEGHLLPSLLMEYRELAKLESTYLDTLPELVHPDDGRLHTSFNQTVAATGRLSSSDPNLQNIPVRRELGRDIRKGFVARAGWQLMAADYSQIELRLLAHLSEDPAFVRAFAAGGDIHRETAAIIFGIPADQVTAEMRGRAKTINFATIYGQGAVALARQLKIGLPEARDFISTYFERFKGVRHFLNEQVEFGRAHGYVETVFHRRRYIPELRDRNFNIRAFGERVATNAPIQGSAADLIKVAMIRIYHRLRDAKMASQMLLQVHDELVFETPSEELEPLTQMVKSEMEQAAILSVPLVVDIGVGRNWLECKER